MTSVREDLAVRDVALRKNDDEPGSWTLPGGGNVRIRKAPPG